jgi:hypothetical protein
LQGVLGVTLVVLVMLVMLVVGEMGEVVAATEVVAHPDPDHPLPVVAVGMGVVPGHRAMFSNGLLAVRAAAVLERQMTEQAALTQAIVMRQITNQIKPP